MVHVPIAVSDKFKDKSEQGIFGDVMMEVDWSVGEVMDALDKNGLTDNTLVIFTSDNGPWICYGNHAGNTGGFREAKGTTFEGGQREPCIIRWPGVVEEGSVNHKLSATIDIFPTLAEIVDAPLPKHVIDGVSILPIIKDSGAEGPRKTLLYYYHRNNLEAVRWMEWKLVLPHKYLSCEGEEPGHDGYPGAMHTQYTEKALYNLDSDPYEQTDLLGKYPEIESILDSIVEAARKDLGDELTDREGEGRRMH